MYDRSVLSKTLLISVLSLVFAMYSIPLLYAKQGEGENTAQAFQIVDFKTKQKQDTLLIEIAGDSSPVYTISEKFNPFRVVLDVTKCEISDSLKTLSLPDNKIAQLKVTDITTAVPALKRFEFTIADTHDYQITPRGNSIEITITPVSGISRTTSTLSISDLKVDFDTKTTTISFLANGSIKEYTVDNLPASSNQPARMFIDIKNVSISQLLREKNIGTSVARVRVAPRGTGARIVFDSDSDQLFSYAIKEIPSGLQVIVNEETNSSATNTATPVVGSMTVNKTTADSTIDELIASSNGLLDEKISPQKQAIQDLKDSFSFSGYDKQRISVDFYKIDVHNVFRLFRQVTDLNIIVDEAVGGTLTLALTDVPWDFALDIILNLLDLEKEERFNTLVIYPKQKAFSWPERAEDNLSFEADNEFVEQEALIIEQSANQPQEVVEAKEWAHKAYAAEKNGDFETATELYEKAAKLWPENKRVYEKLAVLYLVNLGTNAKALYYAQKGLEQNPENYKTALYAAIASANMQRFAEASEFFHRAISGDPPMKEALFSFAAFNENIGQPKSALTLLDKYHTYYAETKDTMLAKARLLDKVGQTAKATEQYKAILASGYQLRPDLKEYILARLAASPQ